MTTLKERLYIQYDTDDFTGTKNPIARALDYHYFTYGYTGVYDDVYLKNGDYKLCRNSPPVLSACILEDHNLISYKVHFNDYTEEFDPPLDTEDSIKKYIEGIIKSLSTYIVFPDWDERQEVDLKIEKIEWRSNEERVL